MKVKFIRIKISGDLAFKFSEMLIDHAERHSVDSDVQPDLLIAHKLWTIWYQSKIFPDHVAGVLVICGEWVLLCLQLLTERLKEAPDNDDLAKIMKCFISGQEVRSNQ